MSWTFRPPLRCKAVPELDARYANDVMKVPLDQSDAEEEDELHDFINEVEISARIRQLDPDQRYFLPLSGDACELADEEIARHFNENDTLRIGYFIPYGGNILSIALQTATPEDAWNWLRHLLEGLQLLESVHIQHGDLHTSNIVVDPEGLLPRIIDFGNASTFSEPDSPDTYVLLHHYNVEIIYSLNQRFPDSQRLQDLHELIRSYFERQVPIAELLRRLQ